MTNLKWHADQLKNIRGTVGEAQAAGDEKAAAPETPGADLAKRARPNPLLRKLRNAQRHRQGQVARPRPVLVTAGGAAESAAAETTGSTSWTRRSVLVVLVPLSVVGMVALFILSFLGSREIVGVLVGKEYLPVAADEAVTEPVASTSPVRTAKPLPARSEPKLKRLPDDAAVRPLPKARNVDPAALIPVTEIVPPAQDAEVPPALDEPPALETPPALKTATPDAAASATEETAETEAATPPEPNPEPLVAEDIPLTAYTIPETTTGTETPPPDETAAEPAAPASVHTRKTAPVAVSTEPKTDDQRQSRRDHNDQSKERERKNRESAAQAAAQAVQLIGEGHKLLAAGDVVQARQLFTKSLSSGSTEAALALGRSFDPKFLAGIAKPNAGPDPATARRWYEEWYRRSVEQGAISPNVRLEKLLQAMNLN